MYIYIYIYILIYNKNVLCYCSLCNIVDINVMLNCFLSKASIYDETCRWTFNNVVRPKIYFCGDDLKSSFHAKGMAK